MRDAFPGGSSHSQESPTQRDRREMPDAEIQRWFDQGYIYGVLERVP
jgi:hypothetical protein